MRYRTPVISVILSWCVIRDRRGGGGEVGARCTDIPRRGARFVLLIERLVLFDAQGEGVEVILSEDGGVGVGCSAVGEREPGRGYVGEGGGGGVGGGPGA